MERPRGVVLAGVILFLMAVWFLVLSGLSWAGRIGDTNQLAVLPADVLRRYQIAGAMSGVLNAGVLIAAGIGVISVAGWARALGLVLGIWMGLGAMLDLLMGESRLGSAGLLVAAVLLTGILFTAPVKAALSPMEPRPTGLTVLGVLYFIQGILMVAVGSPLLLWNAVAGMLILAVLVSVPMIVGRGSWNSDPGPAHGPSSCHGSPSDSSHWDGCCCWFAAPPGLQRAPTSPRTCWCFRCPCSRSGI